MFGPLGKDEILHKKEPSKEVSLLFYFVEGKTKD